MSMVSTTRGHSRAATVDTTAAGGVASGDLRFDWTVTILSGLFLGGGVLDVWAHNHQGTAGKLETFFTPWHAVLYAGWFLVTIFLLATAIRNHARGYAWRLALPAGYPLALVGALIFTGGGVFDMIWHLLFGIEEGIEATYSPSHLLLGLGLVLLMSGPLRAAWWNPEAAGWRAAGPMVISLGLTLTALTLYAQFADPLTSPWAALSQRERVAGLPDLGHTIGIAAVLLNTGVVMGTVLPAVLRRPLPPGALSVAFTLNATLMATSFGTAPYRPLLLRVAAAAAAGIAADLLLLWLRPSAQRPAALRGFAFAVPAILYLFHFLAVMATPGIWWSTHLWTGSIALAGLAGALLSYAFVPPARRGAAWT